MTYTSRKSAVNFQCVCDTYIIIFLYKNIDVRMKYDAQVCIVILNALRNIHMLNFLSCFDKDNF